MPRRTDVGLVPGHIAFDGDPASPSLPQKGTQTVTQQSDSSSWTTITGDDNMPYSCMFKWKIPKAAASYIDKDP